MMFEYNGRIIDTAKDMRIITDIEEFRDYWNAMLELMSRNHPKYPDYGYTFQNGEIVECKRYRTANLFVATLNLEEVENDK